MVLTTNLLTQSRSDIKDALEILFTDAAIGDDDTTPTAGDTTLTNEVFRDGIDDVDKSAADKIVFSLRVAITEANGNTIKEAGWFDDPSAGTMWNHDLVNDILKTSDIQLFLDTTITITVEEV